MMRPGRVGAWGGAGRGWAMSVLRVGGWGMEVGQQFPETMNPIYSLKTVSIASPAHKAF